MSDLKLNSAQVTAEATGEVDGGRAGIGGAVDITTLAHTFEADSAELRVGLGAEMQTNLSLFENQMGFRDIERVDPYLVGRIHVPISSNVSLGGRTRLRVPVATTDGQAGLLADHMMQLGIAEMFTIGIGVQVGMIPGGTFDIGEVVAAGVSLEL